MEKEDIPFLNQLVEALEESERKLEEAYNEKDYEAFTEIKKFILLINKGIDEVIK